MTRSIALLSAVVTLLLSSCAFAQSGSDKVQVTTLADVSAIQAGKPFWLGIKFNIDPGWHIYWTNPGTSGLATRVKLLLPDGFSTGELQFPIPSKLVHPGDEINYAYENEVMLLMQVTPPKDLAAGTSVKITGKATWLVCKEDCMPGGVNVSIELPVADSVKPDNEDLFKEWSAKLPVKQAHQDIASSTTKSSIANGNGNASIKITWSKLPTDVQFIPGIMETGDLADTKVAMDGNVSTVNFNIKNKTDTAPITGLVIFTRADGIKAALEISIDGSEVMPSPMSR